MNPGPHGPEPAPSRVLQYPRGSSGVLLYLIGAMVVTVAFDDSVGSPAEVTVIVALPVLPLYLESPANVPTRV